MRFICSSLAIVALLAQAQSAAGHGLPILITADGSQTLKTDKQVYSTGVFQLLGGAILYADQPGYSITNASQGVSVGAKIGINVIDQLLFWQNGVVRLDSDQKLDMTNAAGIGGTVDKDTVFIGSLPVATYDGFAGWHEHLDYILQSTAAPTGAYGVLAQLVAPGYKKSEPFLLVFNKGLAAGTFSTAVAALTEAEFKEPGDANGDGLVDGADYTLWADHFLASATWRNGNFNYDAVVDAADYTIWADHFNPAPATAQAVPEPATWGLLAGGGLLLTLAQRRRRTRRFR